MRRFLRPAVVIPAVAILLFAAGIVYAVTTGLDSGAVDENEQVLADVGVYPGSKEVGRNSETFAGAEAALPVPKGVVTTAAYAPPEGTDQLEIVNYFLSRLRPDWSRRGRALARGRRGDDHGALVPRDVLQGGSVPHPRHRRHGRRPGAAGVHALRLRARGRLLLALKRARGMPMERGLHAVFAEL